MNLNPKMIQESFQAIAPRAQEFVQHFYDRLFQEYPEVRPMFKSTSPMMQQQKLIQSLVFIVTHLEKSDRLLAYLQNLGSRHTYYGVEPAHYDAVGAVLVATLEHFLKEDFKKELREQWLIAFSVIKEQMLQGAKDHLKKKKAA